MKADVLQPRPRQRSSFVFGFAIVVVLATISLFGLTMIQKGAPALAGVSAPEFTLKTFEGQTLTLSELRGKPIVLNFWASWCNPCREEAPLLEATWRKYKEQGLLVIGADYVDTETEAKKYLAEFNITYPNGPDVQTKISQTYRITGVPETYFITRDGKLLSGTDANGRAFGNWIGPIPAAALQERVELLMKK